MSSRNQPTRFATSLVLTLGLLVAGCGGNAGDDRASTPGSTTPSTAADPVTTEPAPTTEPAVTEPSVTEPSSAAAAGSCDRVERGVGRFISRAGGVPVEVRVFVPPGFDGTALPAVLDWHGLGSNGEQQLGLTGYGALARSEGFIAVHPTGAPAPGTDQNSWELTQLDVPGRDDLAMVDEVIDRLVAEYCVDPDRVYSTGMSNGGFFTARLVCDRADRIAAAVSVAGITHPDGCEPSRPVPYLAFHGTDDQVIRFAGGPSVLQQGSSTAEADAFFGQVMPDEFAEFAADFGCDPEPDVVVVGDEVVRNDYLGCDDDVPLSFYEIVGGGHTWPGSPLGPLLTGSLGRTTDQVDATAEGWDFMSRFTLPG